jgi:hypothetical protein
VRAKKGSLLPEQAFKKGRDFAAWLGLVPKQISTATEQSSAASAGVAIATFAPSSFKAPVPCRLPGALGMEPSAPAAPARKA